MKKVDKIKVLAIISLMTVALLVTAKPSHQNNVNRTYCAIGEYDYEEYVDKESDYAPSGGNYTSLFLIVGGIVVGGLLLHCFLTWFLVRILLEKNKYKQLGLKRFLKAVLIEMSFFSFVLLLGQFKEIRDRNR